MTTKKRCCKIDGEIANLQEEGFIISNQSGTNEQQSYHHHSTQRTTTSSIMSSSMSSSSNHNQHTNPNNTQHHHTTHHQHHPKTTSNKNASTSNLKGVDSSSAINNSSITHHPTLVHRKVAILGYKSVGKSSLTNAFCNGTLLEGGSNMRAYDPTIETTYNKTIRFRKVHFHTDIVDTAGFAANDDADVMVEAHSARLSRNASLGVHGYALVFSLVSRQSFEQVRRVNQSLLRTLGNAPDTTNVPRVLVGTMKDLADSSSIIQNTAVSPSKQPQTTPTTPPQQTQSPQQTQRQVSQAEAQALAASWGGGPNGIPYIECSSKTGEGVNEVFHTLLKEIEKDDGLLADITGPGYLYMGCVLL